MDYELTKKISSPEIEQALEIEAFHNREQLRPHNRYLNELQFMNLVKTGQIEEMKEGLAHYKFEEAGRMSKNPFRQLLFLFISSVTLATRLAIEGGMLEEDAYHLSDIYIQKADLCTTEIELKNLYTQMLLDFTVRVNAIQKTPAYSYPIQQAMDYIFSHLHYKISLEDVSKKTGFTKTYLCSLFKQESGMTITEFIHKKRVAEASNLLRYSEYSISEISHTLGFCSQSHFTRIFHQYIGMTPARFRKTFFQKKWGNDQFPIIQPTQD